MQNSIINQYGLVWPCIILVAWFLGEVGQRVTKIPRVTFYILVGFLCANRQLSFLNNLNDSVVVLVVNIAIGLILFEFGYRINLRWLINNPSIIATSLTESLSTFIITFVICQIFGITTLDSMVFASLAMATSPVVIMYIVNKQRSSGLVTEKIIHLTVLNCILSVFFFKMIFGYLVFQKSGNLWQSVWGSILVLMFSGLLGAFFALVLSGILKYVSTIVEDQTVAFSIFVIFIVALAQTTNLSPLIATLAFGLMSRHRLIAMGKTQRNFGALGELLTIILFIAAPSFLNWHNLSSGLLLALALIITRLITKVIPVLGFSVFNGTTLKKGTLTGLALLPMSIFPMLLLDPGKYSGVDIGNEMAAFSAVILILELLGPIITKVALVLAKENP